MMYNIGFMQGRLSECVDGKIQAFPWQSWESEFQYASAIDLHLIEWTLDKKRLRENPIMNSKGRERIKNLSKKYNISIPSLTGDCFMQEPFWKSYGENRAKLQSDFLSVVDSCAKADIGIIVIPLVDNGRIETPAQRDCLVDYLLSKHQYIASNGIRIAFESDYSPNELALFIGEFPAETFGINYDTGNSAAMGYNPAEELNAYGSRILNVHIKDRILGGPTVPLNSGNANFALFFAELKGTDYSGNFILQTARATDSNHSKVISTYRDMVRDWIANSGSQ